MRVMRLKAVMDCTGLARSTIYKYIKDGAFPPPISLGSRAVGWIQREIEEWILDRIEERDIAGRQG